MYRKTKQDRNKETVQQRFERLTGFNVYLCPYCKKGHMRIIKVPPAGMVQKEGKVICGLGA